MPWKQATPRASAWLCMAKTPRAKTYSFQPGLLTRQKNKGLPKNKFFLEQAFYCLVTGVLAYHIKAHGEDTMRQLNK